jgi:hypothetical protein
MWITPIPDGDDPIPDGTIFGTLTADAGDTEETSEPNPQRTPPVLVLGGGLTVDQVSG